MKKILLILALLGLATAALADYSPNAFLTDPVNTSYMAHVSATGQLEVVENNSCQETGGNLQAIATDIAQMLANQTNATQKTQVVNALGQEIGSGLATALGQGAIEDLLQAISNSLPAPVNSGLPVYVLGGFPSPPPTQTVDGTVNANILNWPSPTPAPSDYALESGGNLDAIEGHASSIDSKITTTPNGIQVDGSAVVQPVSQSGIWSMAATQSGPWAVTANIGATGGLALDSSVLAPQGAVSGGQAATSSLLTGGQYNGVLPSLLSSQQSAFQLDSSGRLLIGALAPGSASIGQVIANQGGVWNIGSVSGPVALPSNAAQESGGHLQSVDSKISDNGSGAVLVDGSAVIQPVSGNVNATITNWPSPTPTQSVLVVNQITNYAQESGGNLATVAAAQGTSGTGIVQPSGGAGELGWLSGIYKAVTGTVSVIWSGAPTVTIANPTPIQSITGSVVASIPSPIPSQPVLLRDGFGNPVTSQPSGSQRALDVGIDVAGQQVDPRTRTWTLNQTTDSVGASQSGIWTTGRTWSLNSANDSVASVQSGTWSVGRTWDLSSSSDSISSVQSGTWNVNASQSGAWSVQQGTSPWIVAGDSASGTANAGNPVKIGGAFNTAQPTVTNGQTVDAQMTARGAQIVATGVDPFTVQQGSAPWSVSQSGAWTSGRTWNLSSANDSVSVNGTVSTSNASVGADAAAAPTSSTQIGGQDSSGKLQAFQVDSSKYLLTDGSAVVQPVSQSGAPWSVTANVGTTGGLALDATTQNVQGSATGGTAASKSSLAGGVYNSSATSLTSGQQDALQLNVNGALRTDGSATTQPISGSLGRTWTLSSPGDSIAATQSGTWNTGRTWSLLSSSDSVAAVESGTWNVNATQSGTWSAGRTWTLSNSTDSVASVQSGAWTAGRTWNLASGSDSVSAVQSGTWTVQQGTPPWVVNGVSASGASNSGNPVKVGGAFNTTQPTVTTGQAVDAQFTSRGAQIVATGADAFTVQQGSAPWSVSQSGVWSAGRTWSLLNTTDSVAAVESGTWNVNATQSGTWTAGRTWTLGSGADSVASVQSGIWSVRAQDGSGNLLTSQANGSARALDVGIDVAGVQVDPRAIRTLTSGDTVTVVQPTGSNLHVAVDSSALPTGAATAAGQTGGSAKTQVVDASGNVFGPAQTINGINYMPTVNQPDFGPSAQSVTAQDTASTTTTGYANQSIISGTPTTGSAATFALSSVQTAVIAVSGTWTGTLEFEVSSNGGTTYEPRSIHVVGTNTYSPTVTANVVGSLNVSGKNFLRARAVAAATGTASVVVVLSDNVSNFYLANAAQLVDGSSAIATNKLAIKSASTPAASTDTGAVVSVRPDQAGTPNQTSVSCGTGSTTMLAANAATQFVSIRNPTTSTVTIWINVVGAAATVGVPSIDLAPGSEADYYSTGPSFLPTTQMNCISSGAASSVMVLYK